MAKIPTSGSEPRPEKTSRYGAPPCPPHIGRTSLRVTSANRQKAVRENGRVHPERENALEVDTDSWVLLNGIVRRKEPSTEHNSMQHPKDDKPFREVWLQFHLLLLSVRIRGSAQ